MAEQKTINIVGSIIAGISILAIAGMVKMILDLQDTVSKADVNTTAIERNSKVLHRRISDNHKKLEEVAERAIRNEERSNINRDDIVRGIK